MTNLEILTDVYGQCEWSESALISLLRVIELTRQDEKIKQMKNMEEHQQYIVDNITNMMMLQHEAVKHRHNYWLYAANLIAAEYARGVS